jgi:hypothetical protein
MEDTVDRTIKSEGVILAMREEGLELHSVLQLCCLISDLRDQCVFEGDDSKFTILSRNGVLTGIGSKLMNPRRPWKCDVTGIEMEIALGIEEAIRFQGMLEELDKYMPIIVRVERWPRPVTKEEIECWWYARNGGSPGRLAHNAEAIAWMQRKKAEWEPREGTKSTPLTGSSFSNLVIKVIPGKMAEHRNKAWD